MADSWKELRYLREPGMVKRNRGPGGARQQPACGGAVWAPGTGQRHETGRGGTPDGDYASAGKSWRRDFQMEVWMQIKD